MPSLLSLIIGLLPKGPTPTANVVKLIVESSNQFKLSIPSIINTNRIKQGTSIQ